jgi:hypothetical protein
MTEILARPPFDAPVSGVSVIDHALAAGRESALVDRSPAPPCWLQQMHGNAVVDLSRWQNGTRADAAWTDRHDRVAAVRTADCLPILMADVAGGCVAAVHAGWRGLAAGVIEAATAALPVAAGRIRAWIGPRICAACYEVGVDVRQAFPGHPGAFEPGRPGHWLADLPAIAIDRLRSAGVADVVDSGICTACTPALPSFRRDGTPARLATLIWLERDRAASRRDVQRLP